MNGWKWVPVEPMQEMIAAGECCTDSYYSGDGDFARGYAAALAAAPEPAAEQPAEPVLALLAKMVRSTENTDRNQPGFHHAEGWNAALKQAMDYVRGGALASLPEATAQPDAELIDKLRDAANNMSKYGVRSKRGLFLAAANALSASLPPEATAPAAAPAEPAREPVQHCTYHDDGSPQTGVATCPWCLRSFLVKYERGKTPAAPAERTRRA